MKQTNKTTCAVALLLFVAAGSAGASSLQCGSTTLGPGYPFSGARSDSFANVNPFCSPDFDDTDPGAATNAALVHMSLSASSSASGFNLMTATAMLGGSGGELSSASALAQYVFSIIGNPGHVSIPLTFDIGYSGGVLLTTTPGDRGNVAVGGFDMTIYTSTDIGAPVQDLGSVSLESVGGVTSASSSGFAAALGIPSSGSVGISGNVLIGDPVSQSGYLEVYLYGDAEAPAASAQDLFNAELLAVTVPAGFSGVDISQLGVSFAGGPVVSVTSAAPEPGSAALFELGGGLFLALRRFGRLRPEPRHARVCRFGFVQFGFIGTWVSRGSSQRGSWLRTVLGQAAADIAGWWLLRNSPPIGNEGCCGDVCARSGRITRLGEWAGIRRCGVTLPRNGVLGYQGW